VVEASLLSEGEVIIAHTPAAPAMIAVLSAVSVSGLVVVVSGVSAGSVPASICAFKSSNFVLSALASSHFIVSNFFFSSSV
jgi:hypothetical protein